MSKLLAGNSPQTAINLKILLSPQELKSLNIITKQSGVSRQKIYEQFTRDILENKIVLGDGGVLIYEAV